MLGPAVLVPPLSILDPHLMLHDDQSDYCTKYHFYVHQQHTVQIIQLVEGQQPPPSAPRRIHSVISSSTSGTPSVSVSESESESEEETVYSSYCSSDLPTDQLLSEHDREQHHHHHHTSLSSPDETYTARMKRIFAWRDHFSNDFGTSSSSSSSDPPFSPTSKWKLINDGVEEDGTSHVSKRSRSHPNRKPTSSLSAYSCPACDDSFPSRQSLRQHGQAPEAKTACYVAVEYAFE